KCLRKIPSIGSADRPLCQSGAASGLSSGGRLGIEGKPSTQNERPLLRVSGDGSRIASSRKRGHRRQEDGKLAMQDRAGRLPSLDGLRAVSILMVLSAHLAGTEGMAAWLSQLFPSFLGRLGVRVFFVISSFLITRLLLIESRATGSIRLGAHASPIR